jgi:tRNA modification GTPase
LSVKDNEDVKSIKNKLYDIVIHTFKNNNESVIISNSRHLEALEQSKAAVECIIENLNNLVSTELITQDIKSALYHLGTITGEIDIDKDILETIFSKFCIGK